MTSISEGLQSADGDKSRERSALPLEFLEWQRDTRLSLFRTVTSKGLGNVRTMPSHLAVIGTTDPDGSVNLATKGIGLVPKPDRIEAFTSTFRAAAEKRGHETRGATLEERIRTLLSFYSEVDNFDDSRLGGLEIFEGMTYDNLRNDPRASLLFSGEAPSFLSYQVDGEVEFVEEGDPYYEFLLSARELFARDCFHVPQSNYPHGFVLRVRRVRDKRPFPRMRGHV